MTLATASPGKKHSPKGELHYVPLARERGNHPERVFTYVCERNRHDSQHGVL
jgi:hypothetical protein